jgi:hypothetical protein
MHCAGFRGRSCLKRLSRDADSLYIHRPGTAAELSRTRRLSEPEGSHHNLNTVDQPLDTPDLCRINASLR